MTPKMRQK